MNTKKTKIEFDAGTLVARAEGLAAGTEPARERTVKLPPPVKPISPRQIRAIRTRLGFTQSQFAALLNVPMVTAVAEIADMEKPSQSRSIS
jgi:DNA-binding transcriptional regulator YiaG